MILSDSKVRFWNLTWVGEVRLCTLMPGLAHAAPQGPGGISRGVGAECWRSELSVHVADSSPMWLLGPKTWLAQTEMT